MVSIERKISDMNRRFKAFICAFIMCIISCVGGVRAEAASPVLSASKCTLYTGETYVLKLNNVTGKVKFATSDGKVAKVNSKGKITAVSRGTAVITATYRGKQYKCKVRVRSKYDKMYDYLMKKGIKNAQGYKEISVESGSRIYSILYNTDKKKFEFKFISEDAESIYGVTSYLGRNGNKYFNTDFMYLKNSTGRYYFGSAAIVRAKYSRSYSIPLVISESYGGSRSINQKNASVIMRRAMYAWNSVMKKKLGVTMKDLGFVEY